MQSKKPKLHWLKNKKSLRKPRKKQQPLLPLKLNLKLLKRLPTRRLRKKLLRPSKLRMMLMLSKKLLMNLLPPLLKRQKKPPPKKLRKIKLPKRLLS